MVQILFNMFVEVALYEVYADLDLHVQNPM